MIRFNANFKFYMVLNDDFIDNKIDIQMIKIMFDVYLDEITRFLILVLIFALMNVRQILIF